ncbi:hypothetical protein AALP_AA1G148200 [Arabis alpina]|uniref:DUF1664 domain-containing protein n=1 Tax=Arabis alpina TaxID=50452 RepID=A0A087HNA3_ARAAL|nr:hypothetical protein AALP_AA1G148200 [Arabis alpina]
MVKPQAASVFHRFTSTSIGVFVIALATSLAGVFGLIVFGIGSERLSHLLSELAQGVLNSTYQFNAQLRELDSKIKEKIMTSPIGAVVLILLIGYSFILCKRWSFSCHKYATKKDLAIAVASLSEKLTDLSENLESAKCELSHKIEALACKVEDISTEVTNIRSNVAGREAPLRVWRTVGNFKNPKDSTF